MILVLLPENVSNPWAHVIILPQSTKYLVLQVSLYLTKDGFESKC